MGIFGHPIFTANFDDIIRLVAGAIMTSPNCCYGTVLTPVVLRVTYVFLLHAIYEIYVANFRTVTGELDFDMATMILKVYMVKTNQCGVNETGSRNPKNDFRY